MVEPKHLLYVPDEHPQLRHLLFSLCSHDLCCMVSFGKACSSIHNELYNDVCFSLASAVLLGELFVRIPVLNVLFGLKKKDKKRDKKIIVPVDAPGK